MTLGLTIIALLVCVTVLLIVSWVADPPRAMLGSDDYFPPPDGSDDE